jgi:hypothetical protein
MMEPAVGVEKVQNLLSMEAAAMMIKLRSIQKGVHLSITTDAWTSCNNSTYFTCTAHFVCPKT